MDNWDCAVLFLVCCIIGIIIFVGAFAHGKNFELLEGACYVASAFLSVVLGLAIVKLGRCDGGFCWI